MATGSGDWRAWVAVAESDRLTIRNNVAAAETPWSMVCFHAQQAAEKMLKALLVCHGVTPPKTHDLLFLLGQCISLGPALEALAEDCRHLNAYSVHTRYPGLDIAMDETEGRSGLAAVERVCAAISSRLPE